MKIRYSLVILFLLFICLNLFAEVVEQDSLVDKITYDELETDNHNQKLINRYFFITTIVILLLSMIILRQMIIAVKTNKQLAKTNDKLNNANKKLKRLSRTDPLTQISNRRDMYERIDQEQKRFNRNMKDFTIIMSDIDDFKEINDKYGHDAGDFILKSLAQLMRFSIREQDTVGRWGGEEFLLLLPETDIEGGVQLAEKIRKNISVTPFIFSDKEISVTMTFGIAVYNKPMGLDECIKKADEALYKGKQRGKNCVIKAPFETDPTLFEVGVNARKEDEI